jgi:hypothetical protein
MRANPVQAGPASAGPASAGLVLAGLVLAGLVLAGLVLAGLGGRSRPAPSCAAAAPGAASRSPCCPWARCWR